VLRARRVIVYGKETSGLMSAKRSGVLWILAATVLAAVGVITGGNAWNWSPSLVAWLLLVGFVVILLLWKLPALQVAHSKALTDENRFDRENEARKTLAQILAGGFLLAGLYSSAQAFYLSREGQITDRFTKAIDQLGALEGTVDATGNPKPKLEVRLGGIYALERIARDSARDHWVIMEVLTAYVREHSPRKQNDPTGQKPETPKENPLAAPDVPHLGADIQAILTVLSRREGKYDRGSLDLIRTNLHKAELSAAKLSGAKLIEADLSGADLSHAILYKADLSGADLSGAFLSGARLIDSDLSGANLSKVDLGGANLRGANLSGAYLSGADLNGADLSGVSGLEPMQINAAHGDQRTKLPPSLKKPTSWTK
jgi:hypothetical protein